MVFPLLAIAGGCQNCCSFKDSNSLGLFTKNSPPDFRTLLELENQQLDRERTNATIAQRLAMLSDESATTQLATNSNAVRNSSIEADSNNGYVAQAGYSQAVSGKSYADITQVQSDPGTSGPTNLAVS